MSSSYDEDDDVLIVENPNLQNSQQPDINSLVTRFEQELHAVLHSATEEETTVGGGTMILPGDDDDDDDVVVAVEGDLVSETEENTAEEEETKKFRLMTEWWATKAIHLDAFKTSVGSSLACLHTHWIHHRDQLVALVNGCPAVHFANTTNPWNLMSFVVALVAVTAFVPHLLPTKRSASPTADLKAFVDHEKVHNHLMSSDQLDDLPTDRFQTYARASCVQAATVDRARNALLAGLYGIPDAVRHDVVSMAILEGVTSKNSMQDTHADIVQQGTAESFMAFWSTVYAPNGPPEAVYQTCAMVTGVTLLVAEQVAEWNVIHEQYQIGVEPCHCSSVFAWCYECPVFDTRIVRTPVLQRHSLSLKKQAELRQWMVFQAVQSAEHLLVESGSSSSASVNYQIGKNETEEEAPHKWDPVASFAWTRPGMDGKQVMYDTSNNN